MANRGPLTALVVVLMLALAACGGPVGDVSTGSTEAEGQGDEATAGSQNGPPAGSDAGSQAGSQE
ncbi:hypothetical protein BH23ACT10_BH23ACT10_06370 [soil metagenome]